MNRKLGKVGTVRSRVKTQEQVIGVPDLTRIFILLNPSTCFICVWAGLGPGTCGMKVYGMSRPSWDRDLASDGPDWVNG